jgi:hypothetical protein
VDEDKPEYIDGLKPGMYFNTVSGQIYGDSLTVQVHGYFPNYTIWKGEKGSGEFNGSMTKDQFRDFEKTATLERDGGDMVQTVDGESIRYTDTRNFIVFLPEYPEDGIMLYPMSSTGIKAARKWNTLYNGRRMNGALTKRYATLWDIKTAGFEKNGYTWKQTSSIKPIGWASTELMTLGKSMEEFAKAIKETGVKYSEETAASDDIEDSDF